MMEPCGGTGVVEVPGDPNTAGERVGQQHVVNRRGGWAPSPICPQFGSRYHGPRAISASVCPLIIFQTSICYLISLQKKKKILEKSVAKLKAKKPQSLVVLGEIGE